MIVAACRPDIRFPSIKPVRNWKSSISAKNHENMVRSQKSLLGVDTDPKGRNLKIAECCWVHFSGFYGKTVCFSVSNRNPYWKKRGIPIRNFKIGEKWTQQHSAIFKLRPFGSVSTSKSDFCVQTIFSWFLGNFGQIGIKYTKNPHFRGKISDKNFQKKSNCVKVFSAYFRKKITRLEANLGKKSLIYIKIR